MEQITEQHDLLELSTEQEQLVEDSARLYAVATQQAHVMAPLMAQEFKIRMKGNDDTRKADWSITKGIHRPLCGKWITVKVNWERSDDIVLVLDLVGSKRYGLDSLILTEKEFKHVTQRGLFPKMAKVWRLANQ